MRLVVDTSILFSFFNKKSRARELSTLPELELCSPKFALEEINNHKEDILKAFSISESQFSFILNLLNKFFNFIPLKKYSKFLKKSIHLSVDPDDIDFFALALFLDCPIWSNDSDFTKQSEVKIFTTEDLTRLFVE